ncbi:MAG TPA: M13 family metallopeptidase [Edaphocola sp.]|nr:M13 family metallopeptidase [Edaphocola sp.]
MKHSIVKKWAIPSIVSMVMIASNIQAQVPAFPVKDLDRSVKPVDNFDQYANGGWKKANPIPSTESRWGAFGILDKENREVRLKKIITNLLNSSDTQGGTEEQQIADFYRSYMDVELLNNLGAKPLQKYETMISKNKNLSEWMKTSATLDEIGISNVFGFGVYADKKNSKMNAVYMGQGGLSLGEKGFYSRDDSSANAIRKEFTIHVDKMFKLAGWNVKGAGKTILDFETKVAALQLSNVELRDPVRTYNLMPKDEMFQLLKNMNMDDYLNNIQFNNVDEVIIQSPEYLKNLNEILVKSPIETLNIYQRWQLLRSFSGYLSENIQNESFRFYGTVMNGVKERKELPKRAIDATNGILGMPLGKIFAKHYFPESSKDKVAEMIENVRAVFGERINMLSWMSEDTKIEAQKKLASFTYKIGYPDNWKDYSSIKINSKNLFENVVNARLWHSEEAKNKIGTPVDKSEWGMTPQTVNAYYSPLNNEIVFPAGILQPPFFNPDADDAINYGGIIAVIGHEFSHGFDDKGSKYDAQGNLNNWWSDQDRTAFDKLANAYISYFDQIEVLPGLKVNGSLTIGENIADLSGLTLAYHALERSIAKKGTPKPIDGFNWKQRFFLGWAQVWHTNITNEALRQQVLTDPHSPATERINAPLRHLKEFQDAWGVKKGDKLYLEPSKRIVIW